MEPFLRRLHGPDRPHPAHKYVSLSEWVALAAELEHDSRAYLMFTTTSTIRTDDPACIYHINVYDDALSNNDGIPLHQVPPESLKLTHDFDSIIGVFQRRVPTLHSVDFWVHPPTNNILRKSVGVQVSVPNRDHRVELSKIPNMPLWTCDKALGRINLPHLMDAASTYITDDHLDLLYTYALRPALRDTDGVRITSWPANFVAEEIRTRRDRGNRQSRTNRFLLPEQAVEVQERFIDACNEHDELEFARDAFWTVEVRGIKDLTTHTVNPADLNPANVHDPNVPRFADRQRSWDSAFRWLDFRQMDDDEDALIFVDVAIEVGRDDHVLLWRADAHASILSILLGISIPDARGVQLSSKFIYDATALLYDVAGFHMDHSHVNPQLEPRSGLIKSNVYMTEKNPTAFQDDGRFAKFINHEKLITPAMPDLDPADTIIKFAAGMDAIYSGCRDESVPGHVRLEGRYTVNQAFRSLATVTLERLKPHLVSVTAELWWTFKTHRAAGFAMLASIQLRMQSEARATVGALAISAACGYALDGLNARPGDHRRHLTLRDACLARKLEHDVVVPQRTGGAFFIHNLIPTATGYTLPSSRLRDVDAAVAWFFNYDTFAALTSEILTRELRPQNRSSAASGRVNNRSRLTTMDGVIPEDNRLGDFFGFAELGEVREGLDVQIAALWARSATESVSRPSNEQGGASWTQPDFDHTSADYTIWMHPPAGATPQEVLDHLLTVVRSCSLSIPPSSRGHWTSAFNHMWPAEGWKPTASTSNYMQLGWFKEYLALTTVLEKEEVQAIRKALKRRWDTLTWQFNAQGDKIWKTGAAMPGKQLGNKKGPWFVYNANPLPVEVML